AAPAARPGARRRRGRESGRAPRTTCRRAWGRAPARARRAAAPSARRRARGRSRAVAAGRLRAGRPVPEFANDREELVDPGEVLLDAGPVAAADDSELQVLGDGEVGVDPSPLGDEPEAEPRNRLGVEPTDR